MSGFEAWAASFHGTMAIAACALVVGMILGWLAGTRPRGLSRRERRVLADRAAARAASGFRAMREAGPAREWLDGYNRIARQGTSADPPYRSGTGDEESAPGPWRNPCPVCGARQPPCKPGCGFKPSDEEEWEPVHVGQALAVANGDPITTGEIRAITEDMDAFMGRLLGEHPVPWPDGSGQ